MWLISRALHCHSIRFVSFIFVHALHAGHRVINMVHPQPKVMGSKDINIALSSLQVVGTGLQRYATDLSPHFFIFIFFPC